MFYSELLQELLKDKKNPVNAMYLHEIQLQWKRFEELIETRGTEVSIEEMVKALNDFRKVISNYKYKYNPRNNRGFKESSPVFGTKYIDDMLTVLIKKIGILSHKGINWDYRSFHYDMNFNPQSISSFESDPNFGYRNSPKFLQLSQSIDFQFRITGRRNFKKCQLVLPLIIVQTYPLLTEEHLASLEYYANLAKKTYHKAKILIVVEALDKGFNPKIDNIPFDGIWVLTKKHKEHKINDLQSDVVERLFARLQNFISKEKDHSDQIEATGEIL